MGFRRKVRELFRYVLCCAWDRTGATVTCNGCSVRRCGRCGRRWVENF